MNHRDHTLSAMGHDHQIHREGELVATVKARDNKGDGYLMFAKDAPVQTGDKVIGLVSAKEYVISLVDRVVTRGEWTGLNAQYEKDDTKPAGSPSFHFHAPVVGSIVGTQQSATQNFRFDRVALDEEIDRRGGPDTKELHELASSVDQMDGKTVDKDELVRFSDVVKRNAWIIEPLAKALLAFVGFHPPTS